MRPWNRILLAGLVLIVTACAAGTSETPAAAAGDGASTLADLAAGWNAIRPGGDTRCAQDTEFAFFARAAAADRLLVYLQGGGACWNAETCDPEGNPTYSRDVDARDNPASDPVGIFDLDNADNPLREHSMVMVPYCTGDVHLGDRVATYTVEGEDGDEGGAAAREITVHHRGYTNVMAALDWAAERFPAPAEIVVAGSSAGSIPSPFYAQVLAERHPEARITSVGDASGSYRRDPEGGDDPSLSWDMLEVLQRHPGYEGFEPGGVDFKDLSIVTARRHPDVSLLQFDAVHDEVQRFYLDLASSDPDGVRELIERNQAEIRAAVPDFRAYLAGGPEHTILGRRPFYTYEVDGVRFRDWLADALAGDPVPDVTCVECERPELHLSELDARIAERARELVAAESDWSRQDDGPCPSEPGAFLSLRCALQSAARELGTPAVVASVVLEARFEALERLGPGASREVDPLRAFNRSAEHADVHALLTAVAESARTHAHD